MIRITCLGAAGTVTGSCYLVETPGGKRLLVDCGLFQGGKQTENRNWEPWGFTPSELEAVFLTHAHIDHSGRLPKLVKDGYKGKIYTSPPTAELCEIMLLDSAHIQEMDAEWQTRKNRRNGRPDVHPLYTTEDAQATIPRLVGIDRDRVIEIEPGVNIRLRNAGHILGSSILELWIKEDGDKTKLVFSGDLGRKHQLIVKDPHEIFDADYLFVESTYGNRKHKSFDDSKTELLEAIKYSYSHGEKVIIPAFAVERTQEILYILGEFDRAGLLPDIPIYLDSPLAIRATEVFRKNKKCYDEEAQAIVEKGYDPFDMPKLKFTLTTQESMGINELQGSAIVIAANGMCTAGRIKHHLKHNLWRHGASIVIVGYQAMGTTGRKIVEGAKRVKIFRENVAVNAKVFTIGGFSAHADQDDLLEWISHFESAPKVFVVHGEPVSSQALADLIRDRFHLDVHIPRWKERLVLKPREVLMQPVEEKKAEADIPTMMFNAIVDLEKQIKELRKLISSTQGQKKLTEEDVERIEYVTEELREMI